MAAKDTAKLSAKFQISIPKAIRSARHWQAGQVFAFTETCFVADLDTTIARSAAEPCLRRKLATADAIVYATALRHGADLLTCDRHFHDLPGVRFISKNASGSER